MYLITSSHGGQADTQTCSVLHHVIGPAVLQCFGEVGDSSAVTGTACRGWRRGRDGRERSVLREEEKGEVNGEREKWERKKGLKLVLIKEGKEFLHIF